LLVCDFSSAVTFVQGDFSFLLRRSREAPVTWVSIVVPCGSRSQRPAFAIFSFFHKQVSISCRPRVRSRLGAQSVGQLLFLHSSSLVSGLSSCPPGISLPSVQFGRVPLTGLVFPPVCYQGSDFLCYISVSVLTVLANFQLCFWAASIESHFFCSGLRIHAQACGFLALDLVLWSCSRFGFVFSMLAATVPSQICWLCYPLSFV
jgi:hypothetical protein